MPSADESLTVSIAMATYNGMPHLAEQMASLFAQTALPSEIVITDDGSTDGTVQYLEDLARESPVPMTVVANASRLGWRANFMKAASLCRGDLVAFCDQDDIWDDDKLATVVAAFVDESIVMVVHRARTIDGDGRVTGDLQVQGQPDHGTAAPLTLDIWHTPLGFSMVFRQSLLRFGSQWSESKDKLDRSEQAAHDQWFFFLAHVLGDIVFLPRPLVSYRLHSSNTMGYRTQRRTVSDIVTAVRGSLAKADDRVAFLRDRDRALASMEESGLSYDEEKRVARARHVIRTAQDVLAQRRAMYLKRLAPVRAWHWWRLRRRGVYFSQPVPVGRPEMLRDAAVTVLGVRRGS